MKFLSGIRFPSFVPTRDHDHLQPFAWSLVRLRLRVSNFVQASLKRPWALAWGLFLACAIFRITATLAFRFWYYPIVYHTPLGASITALILIPFSDAILAALTVLVARKRLRAPSYRDLKSFQNLRSPRNLRVNESVETEFAKSPRSANRILVNFFVQRSELRDLYDKLRSPKANASSQTNPCACLNPKT